MEYVFDIRGSDLIEAANDYIVEQSSYGKLEQNVLKFVPVSKKRQNAVDPIKVTTMEMLPFLGTKNLNVSATVNSDGKTYDTKLIFNNVTFYKDETQGGIKFVGKDNVTYFMEPIDLMQNTVRVRCNCLDFYYRFASFNAIDKSLIGKPPAPYQRKTDRGPVNPQKVPGVCKHLIATTKALIHANVAK